MGKDVRVFLYFKSKFGMTSEPEALLEERRLNSFKTQDSLTNFEGTSSVIWALLSLLNGCIRSKKA